MTLMMTMNDIFDIIIIGGGAAGMSAAIYAARGGMKTLLLESVSYGGQALKTYEVDNYPGIDDKPTGAQLSERIERHARKFGAQFSTEKVRSIEDADKALKTVRTRRNEYKTRTIIFATGAHPKKLGVSGELELSGAGVSYCATCDGAFFKGKEVAVVGGGNTAFEDALYLARMCTNVYIINRSDKFRAVPVLVEQAKNTPNITIYNNSVCDSFEGTGALERIYLVKDGERGFINVSGVIIAIGVEPETALAKSCRVETCELGFIKTDIYLATNINGIFAAGDCRTTPLRQVITAAADGAVAATSAVNYCLKNK